MPCTQHKAQLTTHSRTQTPMLATCTDFVRMLVPSVQARTGHWMLMSLSFMTHWPRLRQPSTGSSASLSGQSWRSSGRWVFGEEAAVMG